MYKLKSMLVFFLILLVNLIIAYAITTFFGIQNTILYQSLTTISNTITYEVIILFLLLLAEVPLLNKLEQ